MVCFLNRRSRLAIFDFNQPLTLAAWIILGDTTPGGIVGQWGEGGFAGDAYMLAIEDARLKASFSEPPLVAVSDPVPFASGTWRFVAMTYDGVTVQLYVDGVPAVSGAVSAAPVDSDQPVRIGLENIGSGDLNYLYGAIDDVRIYHRTLTADDIRELYDLVFQDGFESGDTSAWTASAP